MGGPAKRGFWRGARICFRWCRITVWLCILAVLCGLVYLDEVGLPGFVKRPLLETLRERGLDLQFTRLRLRGYHGIQADNVRFGPMSVTGGPSLSAREVAVRLDLHELLRFHLQVEGVSLHQGNFEWPLAESNAPPRSLKVENIETSLNFLPDDKWSLDDFRAQFANAQFTLSAIVSHASEVRNWKFLHGHQAAAADWPERLRHFSETLDKISFAQTPDIRLVVHGDAHDPWTFTAFLTVNAAEVETPGAGATGCCWRPTCSPPRPMPVRAPT